MKLFPLRLLPDGMNFDFIHRRWWGFVISGTLSVLAMGMLAIQGLNLGIDFTGGVLMEARTPEAADLGKMRSALSDAGWGEVSLQNFGTERDVIIRIQLKEDMDQQTVAGKAKELLAASISPDIEYRKIEFVGPTVGTELVHGAILAVIFSFFAIMAYVWFRFEWQFGVGAITALVHDATMMIGFFVVTRFEFGLPAIAAVLTVVGYSINDSVVIYDRIRENLRKFKKMPLEELLNKSINETLARTVLTGGTTLLAALSLAIFGGEVLRGFSWSLVFGVIVGTYSSIFVSAPLLIYLNLRPQQVAATA